MEAALLRTIVMAYPDIDEFNTKNVDQIWAAARKFFDWERRVMILGEASEEEKGDHHAVLRSLTLIVKMLMKCGIKSEPLEMLKIRLEDSWGCFTAQ
jgi:hypothetical protein